jgi:uracil-DNA glycosylase family 4
MTNHNDRSELAGALRSYLEELKDTGVDALPIRATEPAAFGKARPASGVMASKQTVTVETLDDIRNDLGDCRRCILCETRKNLVFGVGSHNARVLFVGEAPGRDEDLQGEPFVGEAGQLLTKMIKAMGYERQEVYICNVLKCRPPENRNPAPKEIAECSPFLLRQVQSIAPKAIVALGTFASQTLLDSRDPISRLRGRFHDYHGIPLMPTFHPAFLLRSPEKKREVWEDLQKVMKLMLE